jgi:hypothetical protein
MDEAAVPADEPIAATGDKAQHESKGEQPATAAAAVPTGPAWPPCAGSRVG